MADALDYFEQQLAAMAQDDPQALRRVFDAACQRLEFMCATLKVNAYNIFKSLDSPGRRGVVDLTATSFSCTWRQT